MFVRMKGNCCLALSVCWLFSVVDPFHVLDVPGDVAAGKLHTEFGDPLNIDLVRIGQLDGEEAVRGRLVVVVGEVGVNLALAHELRHCSRNDTSWTTFLMYFPH